MFDIESQRACGESDYKRAVLKGFLEKNEKNSLVS